MQLPVYGIKTGAQRSGEFAVVISTAYIFFSFSYVRSC
jgi:hypothetical protein